MRTSVFVTVLAACLSLILLACSGDSGSSSATATPSGPLGITLWHSMPAPAGGSLQRIADDFNASQSAYQVELIFQGSYTESLNKLISSSGSENIPALIQLSDASTQIMVDSGAATPIQGFIDEVQIYNSALTAEEVEDLYEDDAPDEDEDSEDDD